MNVVVATEASTLILCWRASLLASPTVVPASTVPCRCTAPVRARIASNRVVLPLWNGPTSAMHRGPLGPVPFCPISTSLAGREVGPNFPALSGYRLRRWRGWQGRIAAERFRYCGRGQTPRAQNDRTSFDVRQIHDIARIDDAV